MSSDLLSIGRSGATAARIALDLTAQNIANAATEGYVRRSVRLEELAPASGPGQIDEVSLSGVRFAGIVRNADVFRQAEVRRTGSDAARADAEVAGLTDIEAAIEQSQLYPALVKFEASLGQLAADPVNPSLRAAVVEDARTAARSFTIASGALDAVGEGLRFEAADGVSQINLIAGELAKTNLRLARSSDGGSDRSALLDQRDALLERLSGFANISTVIAPDQTVQVSLGGSGGPQLVGPAAATPFASTTAADGTIAFTLGGSPVALAGGALAGKAQALVTLADMRGRIDALAGTLIATANAAQAGGVALDGSPGQPLFSGTGAADIAVSLTSGAQLATAPAGAPAGSRDPANLNALRTALANAGVVDQADAALFAISSAVAGRTVTRDALQTIADSARATLDAQSGVDLDAEAVNLIRFQQAFQASGRAMQVASTLFDTLLAIR